MLLSKPEVYGLAAPASLCSSPSRSRGDGLWGQDISDIAELISNNAAVEVRATKWNKAQDRNMEQLL